MGSAGEKRSEDQALVLGIDPDRSETFILRRRGKKVETGIVRPLQEGKPILGDIVRLKPHPEFPPLCEVETLLKHPDPPAQSPHRAGPPMVSTEAYRRGWEQVFGAPIPPSEEVN